MADRDEACGDAHLIERFESGETVYRGSFLALQRDIGLRLEEIVTQAQDPREQAWATKVQEFLAEHARGNRVTFDELLERPMPQYVLEADDLAQRGPVEQGAADAVDPTEAGTVTPADPGHVQPSEPSTVTPNRAERRSRCASWSRRPARIRASGPGRRATAPTPS